MLAVRLPPIRLGRSTLLVGVTDERVAELAGVTARTIQRWRHEGGIPERGADALACALGRWPAELWPDFNDVRARPRAPRRVTVARPVADLPERRQEPAGPNTEVAA